MRKTTIGESETTHNAHSARSYPADRTAQISNETRRSRSPSTHPKEKLLGYELISVLSYQTKRDRPSTERGVLSCAEINIDR